MVMTRKDYIGFAKILKDARIKELAGEVHGEHMIYFIEEEMMCLFLKDNPRFDTKKFLKATGYADGV